MINKPIASVGRVKVTSCLFVSKKLLQPSSPNGLNGSDLDSTYRQTTDWLVYHCYTAIYYPIALDYIN